MSHRVFPVAELEPRAAYRLLTHCVAPRPIAFVSTLSAEGLPNLAPFSFFMAGGANPPSVVISPVSGRDGAEKDTLRNIRETGEYTISIVTYPMRERMNQTSFEYPHGVSEWEEAPFVPAPATIVKPPRVAESPMAMECRLFQIVPHGNGGLSANYIIGEVVAFHVAEELLIGDDVLPDTEQVGYIARLGAEWYTHVTKESLFALSRPTQ